MKHWSAVSSQLKIQNLFDLDQPLFNLRSNVAAVVLLGTFLQVY